jgi:hypothetical protein
LAMAGSREGGATDEEAEGGWEKAEGAEKGSKEKEYGFCQSGELLKVCM